MGAFYSVLDKFSYTWFADYTSQSNNSFPHQNISIYKGGHVNVHFIINLKCFILENK